MSNGINLIGIPKFQHPWRPLQTSRNSGTWGDRGKGNELQSALEKGLSWIGDKFVNGADYLEDGFNYLVTAPLAAITGKTKEIPRVIDLMRELRHNMSLHYAMSPIFDLVSPIKGGWMLKGLMKGSQLEKLLSKAGTININSLLAYLNKASKLELDVVGKLLNSRFHGLKNINYNELKKAISEDLISYNRIPQEDWADYGIEGLGFTRKPFPERRPGLMFGIEDFMHDNELNKAFPYPVEFNTFTFESPRIPSGSNKHYSGNPLGHSRTYVSLDEPDVLHVMESLSDWALAKNKWSLDKLLNRKNRFQEQIDEMLEAVNNSNTMEWQRRQIQQELLPPLQDKLNTVQAQINRLTESDPLILHLIENYPLRQLLENMKFASNKGKSLMRYPTRESAVKIEGYEPVQKNKKYSAELLEYIKQGAPETPYVSDIYKLEQKLSKATDPKKINNIKSQILKAKKVEQRWLNGETTYDLDLEGILDRYSDFPKMFNKLFKGLEVRTVTDPKGNTWYEIDIPENFLLSEWQFKKGGVLGLNKIIGL